MLGLLLQDVVNNSRLEAGEESSSVHRSGLAPTPQNPSLCFLSRSATDMDSDLSRANPRLRLMVKEEDPPESVTGDGRRGRFSRFAHCGDGEGEAGADLMLLSMQNRGGLGRGPLHLEPEDGREDEDDARKVPPPFKTSPLVDSKGRGAMPVEDCCCVLGTFSLFHSSTSGAADSSSMLLDDSGFLADLFRFIILELIWVLALWTNKEFAWNYCGKVALLALGFEDEVEDVEDGDGGDGVQHDQAASKLNKDGGCEKFKELFWRRRRGRKR